MKKVSVDSELRREMIVGGFTFLVVAGLFVFSIFVTGEVFWKEGQTVHAVFDDVSGLRTGDNVICRGMTVGEVKELQFDKEKGRVQVTCFLTSPVLLKKDCSAKIITTSMLGGRQLEIREGVSPAPKLEETPVNGLKPLDLVEDAGAIVRKVRDAIDNNGLIDDVDRILKETREIAEKINSGQGTLGKLVNDDTVYADLQVAAANLKDITQGLKEGKGMLGKMLSEDDEASLLFQDIRAAVDDFRETAPILTFTSVFFGAF